MVIITFLITTSGFFFVEWLTSPTESDVRTMISEQTLRPEDVLQILTTHSQADKQSVRDRLEQMAKDYGAIASRVAALEVEIHSLALAFTKLQVITEMKDEELKKKNSVD
jgi:hypothetical protein